LAYVEPAEGGGRSRWRGEGQLLSFALCQAIRGVLAGEGERPHWSRRARRRIGEARLECPWADPDRSALVFTRQGEATWWTFAGGRANASLGHRLSHRLGCRVAWDNFAVRPEGKVSADQVEGCVRELSSAAPESLLPAVDERALAGLKFAECLPPGQAAGVAQARLADLAGVDAILRQPPKAVFGD
jgi:ATP-dependent Lhr-like helicase